MTEVNSLTIFKRENESFEREMKRLGDKLKKASCEALLVKAADRLHNLRDIQKNPHCFKSGKVARYKQATAKMLDEIIEPRLQPNRIIKLIRQNLV